MDKEDQSSKLDKLKFAIKVTAEVTKEASKAILNMGKDIASVFGETVGGTIGKLSKILGDTIAKQSKNWSQSIKQLGSVAKNIGGVINGIGSSIINMAKGSVEQVLKIGNSFESFSGKMKTIDQGVNTLGQSLVAGLEAPLNEMGDFGIDAIAQLQESLDSGGTNAMLETGSNLLNQMMAGIITALPGVIETVSEILTTVCQTISQLAPQLSETGFEIISQLLLGIMENMPMLAETALTLILSLVNGLAAQLPVLLPAAVDMVMTLIEGLISNLPAILEAGMNLLDGLITGIFNALPALIERVPEIIYQFIMALIERGPELLEGGKQILQKVIEGIKNLIGGLVGLAGELIANFISVFNQVDWHKVGYDVMTWIINGISSLLNNLVELGGNIVSKIRDTIVNTDWLKLGRDIINGIIEGFKKGIGALLDIAMGACESVLDTITGFFDIFSPSHKMRDEVGKYLPSGIAVGFELAMPSATKDMINATDSGFKKLKQSASSSTSWFSNDFSLGFGKENIINEDLIDYEKLATTMSKIKMDVYMDKTAVGKIITPAVDIELGRETSRKGRHGA
ncbi:phage tail protein [Thomasclavelia cocleata]|uniref:phage tail protein n=1 Tax=Thomasclavelia cocleata TaxID=69824 RepID=UPI00248BC784|nr:hypothetical protein [Thomasclavelia cocleata]